MPLDLRVLSLPGRHPLDSPRPDLRVRPVRPTDRDDLALLYRDAYPPDVGARDLTEAEAEIDATFAGEFGDLRLDASLIAHAGEGAVGAVLVVARSIWDADLPGPFAIELFVAPALRGRGAGSVLMDAAARACVANGDRTLALRVGPGTSAAAHRLYARLGFVDPALT